ncbi:GRIP and coiled-coil domain-containing protein 1 [Lasiodiplodia theobromae]|uniref:GRIP and coiled-coil domain-containing protein 1 n=1 Tax=Lasiodiplodia theobromae TaxID=45133 RepID=A0A5N5DCU3_9PEZI|nr:GRIP and coiled-coil domain-containing protein 1 [Lasiodiplodia theobromae]
MHFSAIINNAGTATQVKNSQIYLILFGLLSLGFYFLIHQYLLAIQRDTDQINRIHRYLLLVKDGLQRFYRRIYEYPIPSPPHTYLFYFSLTSICVLIFGVIGVYDIVTTYPDYFPHGPVNISPFLAALGHPFTEMGSSESQLLDKETATEAVPEYMHWHLVLKLLLSFGVGGFAAVFIVFWVAGYTKLPISGLWRRATPAVQVSDEDSNQILHPAPEDDSGGFEDQLRLRHENNSLRARMEAAEAKRRTLEEEIEKLRRNIERLEELLEDYEMQNNNEVAELEKPDTHATTGRNAAEKSRRLEEKSMSQTHLVERLSKKVNSLEEELKLKSESPNMSLQNTSESKDPTVLGSVVQQLRSQLSDTEDQKQVAEKRLQEARAAQEKLKNDFMAQLARNQGDHATTQDNSKESIKILTEKIEIRDEQITQMSEEADRDKDKIKRLENKAEELTLLLDDLEVNRSDDFSKFCEETAKVAESMSADLQAFFNSDAKLAAVGSLCTTALKRWDWWSTEDWISRKLRHSNYAFGPHAILAGKHEESVMGTQFCYVLPIARASSRCFYPLWCAKRYEKPVNEEVRRSWDAIIQLCQKVEGNDEAEARYIKEIEGLVGRNDEEAALSYNPSHRYLEGCRILDDNPLRRKEVRSQPINAAVRVKDYLEEVKCRQESLQSGTFGSRAFDEEWPEEIFHARRVCSLLRHLLEAAWYLANIPLVVQIIRVWFETTDILDESKQLRTKYDDEFNFTEADRACVDLQNIIALRLQKLYDVFFNEEPIAEGPDETAEIDIVFEQEITDDVRRMLRDDEMRSDLGEHLKDAAIWPDEVEEEESDEEKAVVEEKNETVEMDGVVEKGEEKKGE